MAQAAINPNIVVTPGSLLHTDVNSVEIKDADGNPTRLYTESFALFDFTFTSGSNIVAPGDSFEIALPPEFRFYEQKTTPLIDGGKEVGSCSTIAAIPATDTEPLVPAKFVCTFDDGVLANNGVSGNGSFLLKAIQTTDQTALPFDLNGTTSLIPLPADQPILNWDPGTYSTPTNLGKWMAPPVATSGDFKYSIIFGTKTSDAELGRTIDAGTAPVRSYTFVDELTGPHVFNPDLGTFSLQEINTRDNPTRTYATLADGSGNEYPRSNEGYTVEVVLDSPSKATVTVTGPFNADGSYQLVYWTKPVDPAGNHVILTPGVVYGNMATLDGTAMAVSRNDHYTDTVRVNVSMAFGFGGFEVEKTVQGSASAQLAAGTTFDFDVAWTLPAGTTASDYTGWTAPANPVRMTAELGKISPYLATFPMGTTIVLTEVPGSANPVPNNVSWGTPVFDITTFVIQNQVSTHVKVQNEALDATLEISKVVQNFDGVSGLPGEYVVDYSWPADGAKNIAAGAGSVTLSADGTVASIPNVPIGAIVTFTEQAPAAVAGATWGPVTYSAETVTVADANEPVVVTNSITKDAPGQVELQLSKVVENVDGVTGLPGEYVVDYSWPADAAAKIEAGAGVVTLNADGTAVSIPNVPIGAVVTFTEQAPAAVAGATWGPVTYSSQTLTVADANEPVVVTNSITKDLPGTVALEVSKVLQNADGVTGLPGEYLVDYSWPADAAAKIEAGAGTLTIYADGSIANLANVPIGAVVTFTEQAPAPVAGATWGPIQYSAQTVTVAEANEPVVVTNSITKDAPGTVELSLSKVVVNTDGVDDLPGEYVVDYSWPADAAAKIEAGAGVVTINADGTAASIPNVPIGAVVTFTEQEPEPVAGATWGLIQYSAQTVTVADVNEPVVITNSITKDTPEPTPTPTDEPSEEPTTPVPTDEPSEEPTTPVPTDEPSEEPTTPAPTTPAPTQTPVPDKPEIPATGADATGLLAGSLLLLGLGGAFMALSRRRQLND